jgi:hypothetical protein
MGSGDDRSENLPGVSKAGWVLGILIAFQLFYVPLNCQNFSLSGTIRDSISGENLIFAAIQLKDTRYSAQSNQYGFFSLTAPSGNYTVEVFFIGHNKFSQAIRLDHDMRLNLQLGPEQKELEEVEISARGAENVRSAQMSVVQLDIAEIKKIPAFLGEVDILKTIQLLPGIKNAGDGNTGFYVRGGGPDQNLILLDEANIYNASHLLGFFSIFNGDAIKNVQLYKGNMPAQYGGRLSSVLDISMKDGNLREYHAEGGIGLIASRFSVEGPIVKDKSSFIVSGRRTYIDVLAKPFMNASDFRGTSYFFYDLNAKLNYIVNEKNRIFLSGYFGRDKFVFSDAENKFNTEIPWGNASACLRWNHIFRKKLFANASLVYTNYDFSFGALQQDFRAVIESGITDYQAKYDLTWFPNSRHQVRTGVNYIYHRFTPTSVSAQQGSTVFDLGKKVQLYAHDAAAYISDDWDLTEKLKLNIGIRLSSFMQVGPFSRLKKDVFGKVEDTVQYASGKPVAFYYGPEPRFSMRYLIAKNLSLKASYTRNFQYIHLATISSISLPTDVWMPCTEVIKPQESNQGALGLFRNFRENMFETSIEAYYKTMKNLIEFKEGSQPADNIADNPDNAFTFGHGWAYGAEFFIKKTRGKLSGWIGYTLSWTWRQFDQINFGEKFLAKYDRRHDASVVLTYDYSERWNFGMVWVYGSGNRGTLPNGFFLFEGSLSNDYGLRNSYQFIPYHRMDVNITYKPQKKRRAPEAEEKLKKWQKNFHQSFTLSIFNVYNRYNPYFIYLTRSGDFANGTLQVGAKQVTLFPIIPSITWNFSF